MSAMTTETAPILVLTDAEHSYYLLPRNPFGGNSWNRPDATWSTAGGDLELHRKSTQHSNAADWWRAPGPPQPITATRPGVSTCTGWRLRKPEAASEAYPLHVAESERPEGDDETFCALYVPEYDQAADETLTVAVEQMVLAGDTAPAPVDGLTWTVNILDELKQHPELFHLFPGQLGGFREAVVEAIKPKPYMHSTAGGVFGGSYASIDRDNRAYVHVTRSVPYEPRHTKTVYDDTGRGRKSRRGSEVVESKRLEVRLQVPAAIAGANRAEAVHAWRATMAEILAEVEEALTPAPCWHCQGTGVVSAKAATTAGAR